MQNKAIGNIFKGDKVIWMIFFFLCIVSIVEVYSASSMLSYKSGNFWSPIIKHVLLLIAGVGCMVVVQLTPCKYFKVVTIVALPLSFLLLVAVLFMGKVNDGSRWLNILGITIQPSEFAKGALVLAIAQILSAMQTDKGIDKKAIKYICIVSACIILPILPENLSTALIISLVVYLMMFIGGIPHGQLLKFTGGLLVGAALFVGLIMLIGRDDANEPKPVLTTMTVEEKKQYEETAKQAAANRSGLEKLLHRADTWKSRIEGFLDQKSIAASDYDITENSQEGHSKIAIAQAGVFGKGPGCSTEREFLPQAFSDFIYAIVIEEMGAIGGGIVAFLYVILLMRAGVIARRCANTFPALLCIGIALMLVTQAMFNMFVAVGIVPVTGQPLPLISKGGTSSIVNCIYLGVLLSISRTAKRTGKPAKSVVRARAVESDASGQAGT